MILFCTICICSFSVNAQKNKDIIALLDTSAFKGKPLLNNTIRLQKFFDPFRENTEKVNANQETVLDLPANYFNYLSEMLEQADLKGKPLNNKLKNIIGRKGKEVSSNNTIPIGVFNVESLLLTEEQLSANQDAKKKNLKADSKDYEIIEFIAAGLLQSEAFQGNLSFEIDPSIMISNLNNSIKSISIDFNEGKGFQDYEWKQQTIAHQFSKAGDILIKIKLSTKKGTYITNCPIKIHFLQRPIPSYIGNVSSPSVRSGRIAAGVAGGEYAIFMGCDGILDKPIIIAEGFDPGNNVGIDLLISYYRNDLEIFTRNGYDLVFVNYNDGRDFIENNAEVLKRVIQDINSKKVGHAEINKLSIIGVSMSGLIGRWALKQMENAGQNHEVARLICLDTPHKGANSSPGIYYVAADFANRGLVSGLLEAFLYNVVPEFNAIDSPAAKEQLLFQNTSMEPNVYFSLFQNALVNLGNGGYPTQCKNIAFINGSLNGGNFNRKFRSNDNIIPGDKIWDSNFIFGFCYDYIDCWTNVPNQNTEVYNEDKFPLPGSILFCDIKFSRRSINLPYNLDRLSGGFNSVPKDEFFQFTSTFPRFSFVPTYSAVDYKGALNNDADYSININDWLDGNRQVRVDRQNLTPFKAIYGNNVNDQHSFFVDEGVSVEALARNEFGINPDIGGCVGCTPSSGGLTGTYFNNQDLINNANTRTNITAVNFSTDERRYTPFFGSVELPPNGTFFGADISARWEGTFQAPISANYIFNMRTDDGTRVLFGGEQVVNDYQGNYPPTDHKFIKYLNAGERRNIRIEWRQGGGGYMAKLLWEFNGVESFIPPCHLFPATADCNFSVSGTANPTNIGCGGSSTLTATCVGSGCTGISYAWTESGSPFVSATGSPATVNFGQRSGTFRYNLTASRAGCGNVSGSNSPTINVSGCPPGGGGLLLSNPTGLSNVSNSSNQGSFRVNSTGVNWVISNIPSWATVTPMSGSSGNTDITVSFQANSNNFRTANLSVIDVTDIADDQSITISQQGSSGGGTPIDRTEGGTASDDGANNPAPESEAQAFDNSNFTKWLVFSSTGNIAYDFVNDDNYAINSYTVTSANDDPARDPRNWNFQGSNDGSNWNTVDTRNNQTFPNRFQTITYNISNTTSYRQYRLNVTGNNGSGLLQIAEIQMFGPAGGVLPPPPPPSGCTYTEGQFLFKWYGENVYAHKCGTKYYVTTDAGSGGYFKPKSWLEATSYAQASCFEQDDPRPAGCSGTPPPPPPPTGGCTFTDGQFLLTFNGETIEAKFCNGILYARATWGAWKHPNWLIGAGMNATTANCFATIDPNCGGLARIAAVSSNEIEELVTVFPNPTNGKIKISFTLQKDENVWFNLYDTQGKNLQLNDFEGKKGRNEVEFDLQNYTSGAYFIDLQYSQKREVRKVTKVN